MSIYKKVICLISSFVLMISLGILIANNIVEDKLLNKKYIESKLEESEFHEQISREVKSAFEEYIYQSGLPKETIEGLFTEAMIKRDVSSLVNCVYEGSKITVSDAKVRDNLDKKINEYISSTGQMLTAEGRANIERFKNLIVNQYKKSINISSNGYMKVHKLVHEIQILSDEVGIMPWLLLGICLFLIIALNRNNLLRAINYISISILSLGILLKLCVAIVMYNVDMDNLVVMTMSITNFVVNIAKETLFGLSNVGTFTIFCGLVGIIVSVALKGEAEELIEAKEMERKPKRRKFKK